MLPLTGEVMVVRFELGGYWAFVEVRRRERTKKRYMVVQSCFDHRRGGKRGGKKEGGEAFSWYCSGEVARRIPVA
jgi:hypothetical protein